MNTLQNRVNDFLRDKPPGYAADDSEVEAVDSLFEMLKKAEDDLQVVQARVDRLKWELAKAKGEL